MKTSRLISGLLLSVAVFSPAHADTVTLRSPDNAIFLSGELIDFNDEYFTLETTLGPLRVSRTNVVCEGESCPTLEVTEAELPSFQISGSDTVGEVLMPLLVEGYAEMIGSAVTRRTDLGDDALMVEVMDDYGQGELVTRVSIQSEGSSSGIEDLINDEVEIAMSARAPTRKEYQAVEQQGRGSITDISQEHIFAVDSVAIVVSPENPISELSVDQVAKIFSGEITNWSALGGPDQAINVYAGNENWGATSIFNRQIMNPEKRKIQQSATVVSSGGLMSDRIFKDVGGIGFVDFGSINETQPVDIITSCGIPMQANPFAAKTEEYILQRRLRLLTDNTVEDPEAVGLIEYVASDSANTIIRKAGYIDLGIELEPVELAERRQIYQNAQSAPAGALTERLTSEMQQELSTARRMSTVFRFALGSRRLDNKAVPDVDRVLEFMDRPENANRNFTVVGFTDSDGSLSSNVSLSFERANTVAAILQQRAGEDLSNRVKAVGFGELAPIACNSSSDGRRSNRRVEIWMQ